MGTGKYLNPKADLTFKLVFGEHEDFMMSIIDEQVIRETFYKDGRTDERLAKEADVFKA